MRLSLFTDPANSQKPKQNNSHRSWKRTSASNEMPRRQTGKGNPLEVSLETIIGTSPMLGHRLENRSQIRSAQDPSILNTIQAFSSVTLSNADQQDLFCVAPLDILVANGNQDKQFHLLEINGTGIGGLTNLPNEAVATVLESLQEMGENLQDPEAVVLIAISGKESDANPRLNKLMHEKILYVEALKRGFESRGKEVTITTLNQITEDPDAFHTGKPTVVLGYIKELVDHIDLEEDGRLSLYGRPVTAAVNDRFCLNVVQKFGGKVDLEKFITMNRGFLAGADKGVAYALLNEYLQSTLHKFMPRKVDSERVETRMELIATILRWVRSGKRTVIKPQGTGLGHGIEFFLDPNEPDEDIIARIDQSLQLTEEYYHIVGGAFPYTVCEYVDACSVEDPTHELYGHKYEVRVVVYRDGMELKAIPSIAKISCEAYDPKKPAHLSLINNITTSAVSKKSNGTNYMLPLANRETLRTLGLRVEHLMELCAFATCFIRHTLDMLQSKPECFGLPENKEPRQKKPNLKLAVLEAA